MPDHNYSPAELKLAQLPHQLFIFNSIGNHVLLTVITVSIALSSPLWTLMIPIISMGVISYTLLRGRSLVKHESKLVRCHWGVVLRRTRFFLISYAILAVASIAAYLLFTYAGAMKELMFALVGGLGLLPFMAMVLILTIMESDTLNHAGLGFVSDSLIKRWGTDEEKAELEKEALEEEANDKAADS